MSRSILDSLFPPKERVVFRNNPLVEVTCRVAFMPELNIASQTPSSFHDHIKQLFPLYDAFEPEHDGVHHAFLSNGSTWRVLLTSSWMSLSTTAYTRWEEFEEKWRALVVALQASYGSVQEFQELSLRYIDALDRQELGLEDEPWSELVRAPMGGLLHQLEGSIQHMFQEYVIDLDEHQELLMRFGFSSPDDGDPRFMLDMSFVRTHTFEAANHERIQTELRRYTSRVFAGFLTEKTTAALDPEPLTS